MNVLNSPCREGQDLLWKRGNGSRGNQFTRQTTICSGGGHDISKRSRAGGGLCGHPLLLVGCRMFTGRRNMFLFPLSTATRWRGLLFGAVFGLMAGLTAPETQPYLASVKDRAGVPCDNYLSRNGGLDLHLYLACAIIDLTKFGQNSLDLAFRNTMR